MRLLKLWKSRARKVFLMANVSTTMTIATHVRESTGQFMHEIAHIILNHLEESDVAEAETNFFVGYAIAPIVLIH